MCLRPRDRPSTTTTFYSIVHDPMTTCGCCEAIAAVLPGCNGVMTVHRDYTGLTPCGMKFTTLAGVYGGRTVPRPDLWAMESSILPSASSSRATAGSFAWSGCPNRSKRRSRSASTSGQQKWGVPDLYDKIADETVGIDEESVLAFLKEKDHPALKMDPIVG